VNSQAAIGQHDDDNEERRPHGVNAWLTFHSPRTSPIFPLRNGKLYNIKVSRVTRLGWNRRGAGGRGRQ